MWYEERIMPSGVQMCGAWVYHVVLFISFFLSLRLTFPLEC